MKITPAQAFVIGVAVGIVAAQVAQRWQATRRQGQEAAWQSSG